MCLRLFLRLPLLCLHLNLLLCSELRLLGHGLRFPGLLLCGSLLPRSFLTLLLQLLLRQRRCSRHGGRTVGHLRVLLARQVHALKRGLHGRRATNGRGHGGSEGGGRKWVLSSGRWAGRGGVADVIKANEVAGGGCGGSRGRGWDRGRGWSRKGGGSLLHLGRGGSSPVCRSGLLWQLLVVIDIFLQGDHAVQDVRSLQGVHGELLHIRAHQELQLL
mmetsp:Transcript_17056/g.47221  ORF Transcript_17056/g.47221 Transcript_17056/m.47221 type:complete len:217 (-) Transcript_17056:917-1567(-)